MSEANVAILEPVNRELDLSVGTRLTLGFAALLTVVVIFAVAVYVWHSQSVAAQRTFTDEIAPLTTRVDSLERSLLYVGISLRSYLLTPEPQRLANYRSYAEQSRRSLVLVAGAAALPQGAPDVTELSKSVRAYLDITDSIAGKRRTGPVQPEDEEAAVTLREQSLAQVHALLDIQTDATEAAFDRMSAARDKVSNGLVALSAIGGLLCLGIAWFTTQSIRRPTQSLMRVAGAMERGEWEPALHLAPALEEDPSPRSEMRRLSRAIGTAAAAIEHRERELRARNELIRTQNDELRHQYDQIQAQNEELNAQNQEIQSQSEELHAQSEELQAQSEELQSQNEELTRQGQELRNQSDALIEANERKNHFLGVLAHELRNPLAPISNSIFILKRVPAASEQALRAHAVIERQTKHMIRLIDDLLDITRISQGKIRVQREAQDLVTVVRNCLDDHSSALEQSGLNLALDLPARPIQVRGDYTRLSQVIGNLLSNAIKFTASGGTVSVSLREDPRTREALLDVQDTGIGLDATLLPQLFQPFIQGPNAHTRTNGGLGLGLALVKALVELHGGSVLASSGGENKGSHFTVRLPLDITASVTPAS